MSEQPAGFHEVVLAQFENELDAEIARGHLEAEGIGATVVKDDAGGMLPSLQQTGGVRLLVQEDMVYRAKEILHAGNRRSD